MAKARHSGTGEYGEQILAKIMMAFWTAE